MAYEGLLFAHDAGFIAIILELFFKSVVDLIVVNDVCLDKDGRILEAIGILKKSFLLFFMQMAKT